MEPHRTDTQPDAAPRKAYVETYGCQMNVSDGELMQGILAAGGFQITNRPEQADVILVNTCAIREHAERRVLGRVGELNRYKRDRPDLVLGVTGCMAQRLGTRLLEQAPYVDLVIGPDGYRALAELVDRVRNGSAAALPDGAGPAAPRRDLPILAESTGAAPAPAHADPAAAVEPSPPAVNGEAPPGPDRVAVLELTADENYEGLEVRRSGRVSAWVPVQRGCDHRCTFCIVPYVRGREKNREPAAVLEEVAGIAASGISEVVLLGQTVNSWHWESWTFARLLSEVARVHGIRRVRFTSPHPNDLTPALIEVMAAEPAVCRQLHLPVQAGHDRTLKRMLRRYTVEQYLEKIDRVRAAIPGVALSTDLIVGFPGETEAEFEATLDLIRRVRFDDAFMYKFSPREGTPATRLPREQFVAPAEAQARLERLIELQRAIQAEINTAELGRELDVLVERPAKSPGDVLGRTESYKVAAFPGGPELVGSYVRVRLTETTGATFRAVPVGDASSEYRVA